MYIISKYRECENKAFYYWTIRKRRNWNKNHFNNFNGILSPISQDQKREILSFWKKLGVSSKKYDIRWYNLFNSFCVDDESLPHFIPNDFFHCYVDTHFADFRRAIIFDDKNLYSQLFYDISQPVTIARLQSGLLLDDNYHFTSQQEVIDRCKQSHTGVIFKYTVGNSGGKGIRIWRQGDNDNILNKMVCDKRDFIIQELVHQHNTIASLHKNSLNTIRLMTLVFENKSIVLSAILRMGRDGAQVDNATAGGLFCGINDNGRLKSIGYDYHGNVFHNYHPQGARFEDIVIPNYNTVKNRATDLASRIAHTSRLVSWDFCIDNNGNVMLVEANLSWCGFEFHQMCNGPIFKELTIPILQEVINKKPFYFI